MPVQASQAVPPPLPMGTPLTEACPPALLSVMEAVLALQAPTVRHIPGAVRRDVASTLASCLQALVKAPSWENALRWVAFPKLVLRSAARRGKAHPKQLVGDIQRRLRLWAAGDTQLLWEEASLKAPRATSGVKTRGAKAREEESLPKSVVDTIRGLVEEGALSKATKHLLSEGLADAQDPGVRVKLQSLHPSRPPVDLAQNGLPAEVKVDLSAGDEDFSWADATWDAAMSFPPGSAPGPSGLRPGHLRDLLSKEGRCGSLHVALQAVVEGGCLGLLPDELAPILCAASLIPLKKACGGVRPIAVGETVRRLVGKALLKTPLVQKDIGNLAPRQTGVAVQAAAELIGLGLQQAVEAQDPKGNWITVQVDMINAFNTVHREAVLEGARTKAPGAYNWLRFCYGQHVPLFCQGEKLLESETGVHQGDACGPLAFSLGLDLALDACAAQADPLMWGVWYLDDGTLMGPASAVLAYLGSLQVALA